ncbi:MAG: hypothetical protein H6607_01435 [Flavobacteriales bacterium]|nr:hypothetical protein [Flavobacteriales bacterium]
MPQQRKYRNPSHYSIREKQILEQKHRPLLKAEAHVTTSIFFVIIQLVGGVTFTYIGYDVFLKNIFESYPQIFIVFLGSLFSILGISALLGIYFLRNTYFFEDRIEVKHIFGFTIITIAYSERVSWAEVEESSDNIEWKNLIIYTKKHKFKISSSVHYNYEYAKKILTAGIPRDEVKEQRWYDKKLLFFFGGFSLMAGLLLLYLIYSMITTDKQMNYNELQEIKEVIVNEAKITRLRAGAYIKMELKSYPTFSFKMDEARYSACNAQDYVNNVKTGDTLTLFVSKKQYQTKLTKEIPLDFFGKTIGYHQIPVYELEDKNQTYLSLQDYNAEAKGQRIDHIVVLSIIGLIFLVCFSIFVYILIGELRGNSENEEPINTKYQ